MSDKELKDMINSSSDLEQDEEALDLAIKKSFDEEFDAEKLFVSEDLIARTMAAIRKASDNDTESISSANSDTDLLSGHEAVKTSAENEKKSTNKNDITDITSRSRSKRIIKWLSGIAAALVVGVVGFTLFKLAGGIGQSKDQANSAPNFAPMAEMEFDGGKVQDEPEQRYRDENQHTKDSYKEEVHASSGDIEITTAAPESEQYTAVSENIDNQSYFLNGNMKSELNFDEKSEDGYMDGDSENSYNPSESVDTGSSEKATNDNSVAIGIEENKDPTEDGILPDNTDEYDIDDKIENDIKSIINEINLEDDKAITLTAELINEIRETSGYQSIKSYGELSIVNIIEIYDKTDKEPAKTLLGFVIDELG